jgi:hypothetical protein
LTPRPLQQLYLPLAKEADWAGNPHLFFGWIEREILSKVNYVSEKAVETYFSLDAVNLNSPQVS